MLQNCYFSLIWLALASCCFAVTNQTAVKTGTGGDSYTATLQIATPTKDPTSGVWSATYTFSLNRSIGGAYAGTTAYAYFTGLTNQLATGNDGTITTAGQIILTPTPPATNVAHMNLVVGATNQGADVITVFDVPLGGVQKIQVTIPANTGGFPVEYRIFQDGVNVGGLTQEPGAGALVQVVTVPSSSAVTVQTLIDGITNDGPSWVTDPTAVTPIATSKPITPSTGTPDNFTLDPIDLPPNPSLPPTVPPGSGSAGGGIPVWTNQTDQNNKTNTVQTDLLTNATFRQGVDDLSKGITDSEGYLKKLSDNEDKHAIAQTKLDDVLANATDSSVQATADSDSAVATAALTQKIGDLVSAQHVEAMNDPEVVFSVGSGTWPIWHLPILGDIDTNPYNIACVQPMLLATREVILWFLVYWYIRFACDKVEDFLKQTMIVPQVQTQETIDAKIPVWAQIKMLANVGVIMTGIVAFYGAIVGLANSKVLTLYHVTIGSFVSGAGSPIVTALAGQVGGIAQVMFDSFPFQAAVLLLLGRIVLQWTLWPMFILTAGLCRIKV